MTVSYPPYTDLILDLIDLRHKRGLSQYEVARRMCVTRPAVMYIESTPRRRLSVGIARLLNYAQAVGAELRVVPVEDGAA